MINKIFLGKEIPGMIEACEQILLQECAKNLNFDQYDIVTEFGTFFGRSTSCISAGLKENDSFNNKRCRFYAYDHLNVICQEVFIHTCILLQNNPISKTL